MTTESSTQATNDERDIWKDVEATRKAFTTRFVLPTMGVICLFFHGLLFRPEPVFIGIFALIVPLMALNVWITNPKRERERVLRLGRRRINLRSDAADAVRWLANLAFLGAPLFLIDQPPISIALTGWTIMLLTAQADLFRTQYRALVVGIGYLAGAFVVWHSARQQALIELAWGPLAMASVLFLFDRMERYWLEELARRKQSEIAASAERLRAEGMERDALIGNQMRTISHEVNNLLTIVGFATAGRERLDPEQFERVRCSLEYVRRMNHLVLNDMKRQPAVHVITMQRLVEDVRLLLRKDLIGQGIDFQVTLPPELAALSIRERSGSSFLILRNLLEKAAEATVSRWRGVRGEARIRLTFSAGYNRMTYIIEDNGEGMTPEQVDAYMVGKAATAKADGQGVGVCFVLDECERNCFVIGVTSKLGEGTKVTVSMPLATPLERSVA